MEQLANAAPVGPEAHYFAQLGQGIFEIQQCSDCGRHQFFPRVLCQSCGSEAVEWVQPEGKGTIYSYSIIRRKPEHGGDYNVVLVDLDEGVRLMSRVEGTPNDDLHIGMKVTAKVNVQDGVGKLIFVHQGGNHA